MATGLTKEQLRNELISHGVQPPVQSARKEEFVKLYEQHVAPVVSLKGDFSSDEEAETIAEVTENNTSLTFNGLDVASLSDEDLYSLLQQFGIPVGPIVESTRSVYRRKLMAVMRNGSGPVDQTQTEHTNGNGNGHHPQEEDKYSDSEGEPEVVEPPQVQQRQHQPTPPLPPAQKIKPSPEKSGRSSSVTPAAIPSTSAVAGPSNEPAPPPEPLTSIRKRVATERPPSSLNALPLVDRQGTPTPRPSIRTVTGSSSSASSSQYKFESRRLLDTIDAGSTVQQLPTGKPSAGRNKVPRYVVLLLIVLAVAYITYTYVDVSQLKQLAEGVQEKAKQWLGSKATKEAAGSSAGEANPNPAPDV